MRICYIASAGSTHTQRWINYFAKRGHEIHLISQAPKIIFVFPKKRDKISGKTKILFIGSLGSSFIRNDLELLEKHFDVKVVDLNLRRNIKNIMTVIFKIFKGVLWADVMFSWFAGEHAFWAVRLSKIFRKKSIVVVGGYEVAKIPGIGYGALSNPKSAHRVKYVLKNANKVLTVDDSLKRDAIKNIEVKRKDIQTVPTGYDYEMFKPKGEKENLVITVSLGNSWWRVRLKGLDMFVESAKFLAGIKFLVIGIQGDALKKLQYIAPSNVKFVDPLPQDALIHYYRKAKVYCQLSIREGLPNALCEAMLCECVPVGTHNCGIPTAIGDAGFYVPYGDEKATAEAIREALKSDKGKEARERIKKMFPIERRERDLIKIIMELVK